MSLSRWLGPPTALMKKSRNGLRGTRAKGGQHAHSPRTPSSAYSRIPLSLPNALTPTDALALLQANLGHPAHRFWPDEVSFAQALERFAQRLVGHQQVTDAYLLGLAMHKRGKLVTMDRAVRALLPDKSLEGDFLIMI